MNPQIESNGHVNRFARLLAERDVVVVAGAHDAVSARLIEDSGFDALWVSSLGVSTTLRALPDANLLSCTEMIEVTRNIAARVRIPMIVDAENGYGDANNAALIAADLYRAGAAAICLEDNTFPKRNSFYDDHPALVAPAQMQAKLDTARQATSGRLFVIARTEALIVGAGVREAVRRAYAYEEAGAGAVLMHAADWEQARDAARGWTGSVPLVVIPTRFPSIRMAEFASCGFRVVIYANQALRAAIAAMSDALTQLRAGQAGTLEDQVVSLRFIEDLVSVKELSCDHGGGQ